MSFGQYGHALNHQRYMEPIKSRRMCRCGCRKRVTHTGMANGVGLMEGCELLVRRWVRNPRDTFRSHQ